MAELLRRVATQPRALVGALAAVVLSSATAYALLEGKGPVESLWWVIVTGSTVGYGDFYPETTAGRGVGAFLIVSMFVLALCCGAQLTARLIPDPHVFTDEEQRRVFAALERIEAAMRAGITVQTPPCPACGHRSDGSEVPASDDPGNTPSKGDTGRDRT